MADKPTAKKPAKPTAPTSHTLEDVAALAKRRGFIFQGSEIYGGLAGTWDYGPYGVLLKNNLKQLWWKHFVTERDDVYGLDTAILMNARVWEASGHTGAGFADPLVEDKKTHLRYRADHLLEDNGVDNADELSVAEMDAKIKELKLESPEGNELTPVRVFNLMFQTQIGVVSDTANTVYLRPETAQGMFVNFKNVLDSLHPRLPFGLAQIGKNFRNEITPKDFIFRVRELEIMEFEYFIREGEWQQRYAELHKSMNEWFARIGLAKADLKEIDVPAADRAHYSKKTTDFYFNFPHKFDEIAGLAYRTDFDLANHTKHSGVDLSYLDPQTNERFIPHAIEPTFGLDRHVLAVMSAAYTIEEVNGEQRTVLKLKPELAPVKVAVSPLLRNKPELTKLAGEVYHTLKKAFGEVMYDDNGNIGKRYRRQDEIGTPLCVVVDFDSLTDKQVTIRHRDTLKQVRVPIAEITKQIADQLAQF
ncbi:MAG TPA: glycine--tRNA ligase [Candidatus Saccharimonadales bacterium]|nr:glycine--tRNA ligase [Candidatus Saccharimonadales bacterium]